MGGLKEKTGLYYLGNNRQIVHSTQQVVYLAHANMHTNHLLAHCFHLCKHTSYIARVSGKAGHGQDTDTYTNSDTDTNSDPVRIESVVACVQCIKLCYSSVVLVSPGKGWSMTSNL